MQTGVNGGSKQRKRKYVTISNIIRYNWQKKWCSIHEYQEKLFISRIILRSMVIFHYNIRASPVWGIGYVDYIRIPCSCNASLRKLVSSWDWSQDEYT